MKYFFTFVTIALICINTACHNAIDKKIKATNCDEFNALYANDLIKEPKYAHLVKYAPIIDAIDKHTLFTPNGKEYKRTSFILTKKDSLEGKIKQLPYELACMQYIKSVSIIDNEGVNLEQIFKVLGQIKDLEVLQITRCKIEKLPKGIKLLRNLRELSLDFNDIRQMPKEIKECKNLKSLYILGNPNLDIDNLFDVIQDLPIEYLHIGSCNLKYLPRSIGKIKKLKNLVIDDNFINDLPCELSDIVSDRHQLTITVGKRKTIKSLLKPCFDSSLIVLLD
jgi:Leucine-rich repeat (LRR) protein